MRSTGTNFRVLIIGFGNPLRGDDGVGWQAAERLERSLRSRVEVLTCHQLTPELSDPIAHSGLTIFIDACATTPAGQVDCQAVSATQQTSHSLNHSTSPAALLRSAHTIFGHAPQAFVITVGGESFGYSEKLSPAVAGALNDVVERVKELIANFKAESLSHA